MANRNRTPFDESSISVDITPASTATSADTGNVRIRVTRSIELDYERRGVFPLLRLKLAVKFYNRSTGWYSISMEEAKRVLLDAQRQRQCAEGNVMRGLSFALTAHVANVAEAIDREEERRANYPDEMQESVKAAALLESELLTIPASESRARNNAQEAFCSFYAHMKTKMFGESAKLYRWDATALEEFEDLMRDLSDLVHVGGVIKDEKWARHIDQACNVIAAKRDSGLQRFIGSLAGRAGDASALDAC